MAHQMRRKEAAWKSRKQEQHPHGKIKSLKVLSSEYEEKHTTL
ncbi:MULTISPECIES: DUF6254 family protein [Paenibacillus]|nr:MULTISPECIES: DUF6254 family protein [Paenibacillus]